MEDKIGVYICKCGTNITEKVDVDSLVQRFGEADPSLTVCSHGLLCSEDGKAWLKDEIVNKGLSKIVVGACSPRQHEPTFRKVCSDAGRNPFMMQMANIRELCAWTTEDPGAATEKARVLVNGALARVKHHVPLIPPEMDMNPDVMVIGAGVAGIAASLLLAQKGRNVFLVEKAPCIGGMVVQYEDVFPNLECAPCMLEPMMDHVLHNDRIETLTCGEVDEVKGFLGNFIVTIRKKARRVSAEMCYGCGECYAPCPVSVPNEYNENLDTRKAIYSPFAGALPNVPVIDTAACLRFTEGSECSLCADACGFGAVDFAQEDALVERKVGAVVIATGAGLFDVSALPAFGYGKIDNVVTNIELERYISSTGPTEGKVILKNGAEAKSFAMIHCVGSRAKDNRNYCSGTCCLESLKLDVMLRHKAEGAEVTHYFVDWCLPGKTAQAFHDKAAAEEGASFIRAAGPGAIAVKQGANGKIAVECLGADGKTTAKEFDMAVLNPAVIPGTSTEKLSAMFQVSLDANGFFKEAHNRISQVATNMEGVYVAGCASGPTDIAGATSAGKAAAGEALSLLVIGEQLELEAVTACISETLCTGCKACISMCPYKALSYEMEKKIAVVNEALCRGCGTCVVACPSGAADGRNFSAKQMFAEIEGVLA